MQIEPNQPTTTNNELTEGQEVLGTIFRFSPLGANVKFNENLEGLLYEQEVYPALKVGDKLKFYIKKIRDDGKIDLTLDQSGYKNFIDNSTTIILSKLRASGGFLNFTDKSDPDEIRATFQMSKKKFKETIGLLYKKRQIDIEENGIRSKD